MKSVSRPPERTIKPAVDQPSLIVRLLELSRNSTVKSADTTRFKFLLAYAQPSYKLNTRLMVLIRKHPELTPAICSYIGRYTVIPSKMAANIVGYLCDGPELYHSVNGALLNASFGRMTGAARGTLEKFAAERLVRPMRGSIPLQPTYKEALVAWSVSARTLSYFEYNSLLFSEPDWWVQKRMLRQLDQLLFGAATYADLLNRVLRIRSGEASRIAASRVVLESIKLARPYGDVDVTAKQILKTAGVIRSSGQPDTRINQIIAYILNRVENSYDWKTLFGTSHGQAERLAILLKRNFETNIDAFLVLLDSYCDLIAGKVWARMKPGKIYPNYGHAIKDSVLGAALPDAMAAFSKLHDLRLQSATAHPRTTKTGKPTRRLKHRDFYALRLAMINAFDEFERVVGP